MSPPQLQRRLQWRQLEIAVIALSGLLAAGAIGSLNMGIELGGAGQQHEQSQASLLAGRLELGYRLAAAIDVEGADRNESERLQFIEEGGAGGGPRGPGHAPA